MLKSKICCTCRKEKSHESFGTRAANRKWLRSQCRECSADRRKIWYRKKGADQNIRLRYGITAEYKQKIIDEQGGVCAICFENNGKTLNVDHDHVTGKIRGLLCNTCNRALGYFHDSKRLLTSAWQYLNRGEKNDYI